MYFGLVGWSLIEVETCLRLLCIMLSKRGPRPFHGLGMEVEVLWEMFGSSRLFYDAKVYFEFVG